MNRSITPPMWTAVVSAGFAFLALVVPSEVVAQGLTLRAGADIRPLIALGSGFDGVVTPDELSWVGVHIAPGLKLAEVITLEVDFIPLIPLAGPAEFDFLVAPGIWVDLFVAYARAAIPFGFRDGVNFWFEGGAGISFLGKGYLGLLLDYTARYEILTFGAEVGFRF